MDKNEIIEAARNVVKVFNEIGTSIGECRASVLRLEESFNPGCVEKQCVDFMRSLEAADPYEMILVERIIDLLQKLNVEHPAPSWIENTGYIPECKEILVEWVDGSHDLLDSSRLSRVRYDLDDNDAVKRYIIIE